jgi:DnaJ-class molecular chaperone
MTPECPTCDGVGEVWTGDREMYGAPITAECRDCAGTGYDTHGDDA